LPSGDGAAIWARRTPFTPGRRPDAVDRFTRISIDEEDVARRDEGDNHVRLRRVDRDHVRPHREGTGLCHAKRRDGLPKVNALASGGRRSQRSANSTVTVVRFDDPNRGLVNRGIW
jgi:hypothetical protein